MIYILKHFVVITEAKVSCRGSKEEVFITVPMLFFVLIYPNLYIIFTLHLFFRAQNDNLSPPPIFSIKPCEIGWAEGKVIGSESLLTEGGR